MPCSCSAPCVEVEGKDTCTACGLERPERPERPERQEHQERPQRPPTGVGEYAPRRLEAFRRYVGALAINEAVAVEAVRVYKERVLSRGLLFRGMRNAAVRLACVATASSSACSAAVKESVVRADTAECARYGYARLRRALDRALDTLLGAPACFVGVGDFGVQVDAYQRAVAKLGAPTRLVRVCARVDAACFTPAERARYRDGSLAASVLLAVATKRCTHGERKRLGVNVRTARRVRATIEERAATSKALSRALSGAA